MSKFRARFVSYSTLLICLHLKCVIIRVSHLRVYPTYIIAARKTVFVIPWFRVELNLHRGPLARVLGGCLRRTDLLHKPVIDPGLALPHGSYTSENTSETFSPFKVK